MDQGTTADEPATGTADPPSGGHNGLAETLDQRVQRLEDAVAALQDTQIMEERILERLLGKSAFKAELRSLHVRPAEQRTAPPPAEEPGPPPGEPAPSSSPAPVRQSWVIVEVFREIRTMIGMFFDHRFHVSWGAVFALLLVAYILLSRWLWTLWAGVPLLGLVAGPMNLVFVGDVLDKAVDLLLFLFAFKTLSREVARYREVIANYPSYYGPY